jgi:succinylglutamate desuccinylase
MITKKQNMKKIMMKKQLLDKIPGISAIYGNKPGKTSVIMAGNHGNETCGINLFKNLIPALSIDSGIVIFVLGNLRAIEKNIRFTEYNLNRAFSPSSLYSKEIKKTYEYKRAQELKKIFNMGDALLDIHSTTNPGEPFIIAEKNALEIISRFPKEFKRIVYGFDEIEPGASDGYMLSKNKIGICIECGQHESINAVDLAQKAVFSFLNSRGHINLPDEKIEKREMIQMNFIYYTETDSFELSKKFFDFEKIKKGSLIGKDGQVEIFAQNDGVIVFAHDCNEKGKEGFLMGYEM